MSKNPVQASSSTGTNRAWTTRGFEDFRKGKFGNAGENLYVSRAGVLQRIHLFDLNKDGYVDLLFCNSQEHNESPPAYVYSDVLGDLRRAELPSAGSPTGDVADVSGDGYDDLVLGMEKSGEAGFLNAYIYFGSPEGLSESYMLHLPADRCTSTAAGDFNGDGRTDLAFIIKRKLRLFYQGDLGLEAGRFIDLDIKADQVSAFDLDGDGAADLLAFNPQAKPRIYWGGGDGIDPECFTELGFGGSAQDVPLEIPEGLSLEEQVGAVFPVAKAITLNGVPHVFIPFVKRAFLVPVYPDRTAGLPLEFNCRNTYSVAAGDVNGNGSVDLVFACCDESEGDETSWIYWGDEDGFDEHRRTAIPSVRACDVAVGDLDGSGCDDVVICQRQSDTNFTFHSRVFRGRSSGLDPQWLELATEGARRVFIARTSDEPDPQVVFVNHRGRDAVNKVDSVVYYGDSDGYSPNRSTRLSGRGAVIGSTCDFNDDGWPDIVVANSYENAMHLDEGSFLFYGGPDGFKYDPDVVIPTRKAWNVRVADLNRDGHLDLIVGRYYHRDILVYRGTPEGLDVDHPEHIWVPKVDDGCKLTRKMCLGDVNNNGWLDMVICAAGWNRCAILWGGPEGFDDDRSQYLPTGQGGSCFLRDLSGNGYLDLVIGSGMPTSGSPHDSWVTIYWNGPDGFHVHRRTELHSQKAIDVSVADFNNNGLFDLFVVSYCDAINRDIDAYIYWNRPGKGFSAKDRMRIRAHSSAASFAADLNENGYVDLVVANHKTFNDHLGDAFIFWNGPDGLDESRYSRLPVSGPHGMFTNEPVNILTGGPEEYYESVPFQLPNGVRPESIDWQAELPPKTWVRAQLRSGPDRKSLEDAAWSGPDGKETWYACGQPISGLLRGLPWIQYRLALGATNGGCTPRVTEVNVYYQ